MSARQAIDIAQYARLVGVLCRLFELIGIKGRAKPLDPMGELARALEAYADQPVEDDDEDEPPPFVPKPGKA